MTVITAEGSAERYIAAERATLTIHVSEAADAPDDAVTRASSRIAVLAERAASERAAGAATWHEVAPVSVFTRQVGREGERTEYVATGTVTLKLRELQLVGRYGAEFSRAGHFVQTTWSLTDETRRALERDVRIAAVADARARAEDYAAALRETIHEVLEVSETGGGVPMMFAAARSAAGQDAADTVTIPEETVRASVTARFDARSEA